MLIELHVCYIDRRFKNIELLVSKCYHPSGIITMTVVFQHNVYVSVLETAGENPLLDSRFPDISGKGRGYQLQACNDGLPGWPQLRKVSIWQTVGALEQVTCVHPRVWIQLLTTDLLITEGVPGEGCRVRAGQVPHRAQDQEDREQRQPGAGRRQWGRCRGGDGDRRRSFGGGAGRQEGGGQARR